jgi:hypothetical protein
LTTKWYEGDRPIAVEAQQVLFVMNDTLERHVLALTKAVVENDREDGQALMVDVSNAATECAFWWLKQRDMDRLLDHVEKDPPPDGHVGMVTFGFCSGYVRAAQALAGHMANYLGNGSRTLKEMGRHKGPAERALLASAPNLSVEELVAWREVLWADAIRADQILVDRMLAADMRERNR